MSKIALSGPASGTATYTISAPTGATDRTITLPDQTATLITNSSGVLDIGSGQLYKDASGNVGIGTSSPQLKLVASNGGVEEIALSPTGGVNSGTYIQSYNRNTSSYLHNTNFASSHTWYSGGTRAVDIDSSGNLLVGTTTNGFSSTNYGIQWNPNGESFYVANTAPNLIAFNRNDNNGIFKFFRSGTQVGAVSVTTTTTTYATSSDYRLKEDVAPMTGALSVVSQLKPCTYKWKADGSDGQGFIAHELQAVVPECVTGEKDAVDANGNPVYQGIDTSFLVATLTAAIQEQQAIITALTSRVTALEGTQP